MSAVRLVVRLAVVLALVGVWACTLGAVGVAAEFRDGRGGLDLPGWLF